MRVVFQIISSILFLGLTSCFDGGGNGGGGNGSGTGDGGTTNARGPQSKEEALQMISSQHRANFEEWQNRVVKACDSAEAFGIHNENKLEHYGVDGVALLQRNNQSIVLSDGPKLAILTGYKSFSGMSNSKTEETRNDNGQVYTISVEAKRDGSNCAVYLFGQKVYETKILESFTIGMHHTPEKEVSVTSRIPIVRNLGINGSAEVVQHGLFAALAQALRPDMNAQVFFGAGLGLTAEQSARHFKFADSVSYNIAARIDSDQSSVWSNAWGNGDGGNLISHISVLKSAFDGSFRVLNLEIRLPIAQMDFSGIKNTSDEGNLKLLFSASLVKKDNGFLYTLKGLQNSGLVAFNQSEAETCANDRLRAYLGTSGADRAILPSINTMFGPCQTIFSDIENASYSNGWLKSKIPLVFANITPTPQFQYGGWDYVVGKYAKEALTQNKDITTELDPSNSTKIIGIVSRNLAGIKLEIENSKNMRLLQDAAFQMGLEWSFKGLVASASRISQIIHSLDNSVDIFRVSTERVLNDMSQNPNTNSDLLAFALSLDDNFKREAARALSLSMDLRYDGFERSVFNQVIQRKISIDEIKNWSDYFSTIKTQIDLYPAITAVKGELVEHSITWLKNGTVSTQGLSEIYSAINNSIEPFAESTQQLVRDLGRSLEANKSGLDFAKTITNEYKQLAINIRNNSKDVGYESIGITFFNSILQKRPEISVVKQYNDLWESARAFIQREKDRLAGDRSSMPEWNRKKVIEVAVKEIWSGKEFTALEAIAPVAKSKNTCDRYKDASSQADCAGMSLFSKDLKKFFDPAYGDRYANLGTEFIGYMGKLSGFSWTTLRWTLVSEFFGTWEPIWSKCDNVVFSQKTQNLSEQVQALSNETDQQRKWQLERQIKETIKNCS